MGHTLNEYMYWAKGPDLLNSFLNSLLALIGNIKKMYHSVGTTQLKQHMHRFLWRDMDTRKEPDTYIVQRVSSDERLWGTIATVALRKTAEMAQEKYPQEAKIIRDNTYMDDIIESVGDRERAESVTRNIEKLVDIGGFKIKGWTISGSSESRNEKEIPSETYAPAEKVSGVCWRPVEDLFCFKVMLIFSG